MQSILRKIKKTSKKGQVIDLTSNTVISIMILIFTVVAVLFGIAALKPETFFSTKSAAYNATENLTRLTTEGVGNQFAGQIPTVFLILGIVLAISAIAILIMYVRRMSGGGGNSL